MSTVRSLTRRNAVLGAAVVVLLGVLLLRPSETSVVRTADLPLLFPRFKEKAAGVRSIVLAQQPAAPAPGAEPPAAPPPRLELVRRGDDKPWVLASSFDHPVREGAVDRLLDGISTARRKELVTEREETFASYADAGGWVRVEVKDGLGQPLATFSLGKVAGWPEVYLLAEEGGKRRVVRATGIEKEAGSLRGSDWIEALLWPGLRADDVTRLEVEQRKDGRTLAFEKAAPAEDPKAEGAAAGPTWRMTSPAEGEAIRMDVENLVRYFAGLRVNDVAAGVMSPESDAAHGLDAPELVIAARLARPEGAKEDPPALQLEVGKKAPGDTEWYARRRGQSWVYKVPSYSIDPFRKDPSSFLVKKEEPPKEAPKDAPPKDGEAPKDEAPKDEAPKDEAPKDEPPKDEAPKDGEAPKDEAPKDEAPKDGEAPKDEAPKDEAPKDGEAPKDEAPKDEAPKDEAPKDDGASGDPDGR